MNQSIDIGLIDMMYASIVLGRMCYHTSFPGDFPGGSDGKASVYNAGDPGSIPGLGSLLEKKMAIHSSTIAWKIPWTEEPGRLQSMGSQKLDTTE